MKLSISNLAWNNKKFNKVLKLIKNMNSMELKSYQQKYGITGVISIGKNY